MIPWLEGKAPFPALDRALQTPNGLLCAGGDLSPKRLLNAYQHGIFPWYSAGEPILWWSPDPRMVLIPSELHISRSLRRTLRGERYQVKLDSAFAAVIHACASTPRAGQQGTWITHERQHAYWQLFELGIAHSVETWVDEQLVGGLYGLAIGRMFYGESMFARRTDASKIAVSHLARYLAEEGFGMIDCQMSTAHLASLGAREISRATFIENLRELVMQDWQPGRWPVDAAHYSWS